MTPALVARLTTLGVLRVSGADASRFLQGQLSQDLTRLPAADSLLAGLHSPQGRVIAVLRLGLQGEAILLILPRELAATVSAHLSRYVLRAKVRIEDVSEHATVYGIATPEGRRLQVVAGDAPPPPGTPLGESQWHLADIAAGLPQVYAATSGHFVAQMLNMDRLDGIAFTKGCYTGQEIIARAHYLGRVKRRMQRYLLTAGPAPRPGGTLRLAGGEEVQVVDSAGREDGTVELLAVAPCPQGAAPEVAPPGAGDALSALPLPYALEG
jgi:tRNA-modifying protein YgfZ